MKIIITILALISLPALHAKSFYEDLDLGMGMTDNANFESADKDSDTYWLIQSSSTYMTKQNDWNLWLAYKDYETQISNNSLSWSLSLYAPGKVIKGSSHAWNFVVGGLKYTEIEPASTEDGFDYTNIEITYINQFETDDKNKTSIETRYTAQQYASDRLDHILDFHNTLVMKSGKAHLFTPYFDFGLNYSSDELNTKYFYELGLKWDWAIRESLNLKASGLYGVATYLNRTTSSVTLVSKNKNKTSTITEEENESQTSTEVGIELSKTFNIYGLNAATSYFNQSSNSGNETYSEVASKVYITLSF